MGGGIALGEWQCSAVECAVAVEPHIWVWQTRGGDISLVRALKPTLNGDEIGKYFCVAIYGPTLERNFHLKLIWGPDATPVRTIQQ